MDVIPYNNRNDGGLLSLVEVPEKAIVPFMVNAFDYMLFQSFGNNSKKNGFFLLINSPKLNIEYTIIGYE